MVCSVVALTSGIAGMGLFFFSFSRLYKNNGARIVWTRKAKDIVQGERAHGEVRNETLWARGNAHFAGLVEGGERQGS